MLAKQLSDAATALVTEARANGKLAARAPRSNPTSGGEACATTFIKSFGAAAYGHALTDDEVASLVTIYHGGADGAAYNDAVDRLGARCCNRLASCTSPSSGRERPPRARCSR